MNIWDETPPSESADGPTPASPDADPGATGATGAGGGSGAGGGGEPPSEPPERSDEPESSWWSQRIAGVPAWLLLALGLAIWVAVIAALLLPGSDDDPNNALDVSPTTATSPADTVGSTLPATTNGTTTLPTTTDAPTTLPTTSNAPTTLPTTTDAPTTLPTTTDAPTTPATTTTAPTATSTAPSTTSPDTTSTAPTTTAPATTTTTTAAPATTTTTAPATTTTTTAPATTVPDPTNTDLEPTTVIGDDGQSITVTPYRGPCSSGPDCLVVGFTIDGWATHPMGWTCEFSSGARYAFEFTSGGADPACSTVDVPDSIIIDIEGLRTEPITIG